MGACWDADPDCAAGDARPARRARGPARGHCGDLARRRDRRGARAPQVCQARPSGMDALAPPAAFCFPPDRGTISAHRDRDGPHIAMDPAAQSSRMIWSRSKQFSSFPCRFLFSLSPLSPPLSAQKKRKQKTEITPTMNCGSTHWETHVLLKKKQQQRRAQQTHTLQTFNSYVSSGEWTNTGHMYGRLASVTPTRAIEESDPNRKVVRDRLSGKEVKLVPFVPSDELIEETRKHAVHFQKDKTVRPVP
eukprot:comp12428_c0_seq1/m.16279 comp12428_c0_seq1/g.16279  ORF comp12428_c0_seq1/g.16279 comp12428_c0_seq1/m.16279 type:complete len:248 (+) comp12428_c0_seq1:122-865(+)